MYLIKLQLSLSDINYNRHSKPGNETVNFHKNCQLFFKGWPIGPMFSQYWIYKHTYNQTFKWFFIFCMFPIGDVDCWISVKGEVKACMFPEQVTETCTHLTERGYLLLWFCTFYGICCIPMRKNKYGTYLEVDLIPKTSKNIFKFSCLSWGFEPRTFQSWIFCLAIQAIKSVTAYFFRFVVSLRLTHGCL